MVLEDPGDHPRVCGEQATISHDIPNPPGSPPRVRGTVSIASRKSYATRITPACAGNSAGRRNAGNRQRDHPRVCGEQHQFGCLAAQRLGSPPRVRGTVLSELQEPRLSGITPACAGNSPPYHCPGGRFQDHPRVCGEQPRAAAAETVLSGSPPRVRGTGAGKSVAYEGAGITPACAGNRSRINGIVPKGKDHPRVCGEQPRSLSDEAYERGSPPRVRGTGFQCVICA